MSTYTHAKVDELDQKGNGYCCNMWLKNAPIEGSGGQSMLGSYILTYKLLVVNENKNKMYYGDISSQEKYLENIAATKN